MLDTRGASRCSPKLGCPHEQYLLPTRSSCLFSVLPFPIDAARLGLPSLSAATPSFSRGSTELIISTNYSGEAKYSPDLDLLLQWDFTSDAVKWGGLEVSRGGKRAGYASHHFWVPLGVKFSPGITGFEYCQCPKPGPHPGITLICGIFSPRNSPLVPYLVRASSPGTNTTSPLA